MATLTLTFDLPEEQVDARVAQDGWKYRALLWDLDQECRQQVKYQTDLGPDAVAAYQQVRDWIREMADDRGVRLDDD